MIVMVIDNYLPYLGGAELQAQQLGRELVSRGHRVIILTRGRKGLSEKETIDGVEVARLPVLNITQTSRLNYLAIMLYLHQQPGTPASLGLGHYHLHRTFCRMSTALSQLAMISLMNSKSGGLHQKRYTGYQMGLTRTGFAPSLTLRKQPFEHNSPCRLVFFVCIPEDSSSEKA